tara:strand:+ start:1831 stop:2367 length:537 start_codon:yes stop_codon:yes gene_type:complete
LIKNFEDIWPLMKALWPTADLGEGHELRNLYRERLSKCKPELLESAIKDVRTNYSSKTPELKWILERYRHLLREWESNRGAVAETKEEDDAEFMKGVEADRERTAFNLSLLSPEEIGELREEIARRTYLQGIVGRLHGPPESWTHFSRGMAWALYSSLLSDQSQGHSQGQEHQELLGR